MVKFAGKKYAKKIGMIVDRATSSIVSKGNEQDRKDLAMDISACHANGCRLDLDKLLAADDFNFAHDILGIQKHLDRTTGKLTGHFLPRFKLPKS